MQEFQHVLQYQNQLLWMTKVDLENLGSLVEVMAVQIQTIQLLHEI